jgi:hypothetical protein
MNVVEISEFVRDQVLTIRSVSGPTPFVYRYSLSPSQAGTDLRRDGEISGEGLGEAFAFFAPFASAFFEGGMRSNLCTLKEMIERH